MEKKTETVVIHVDELTKIKFERLAKERGLDCSKLGRVAIEKFLKDAFDEYRLLQAVFDFDRTDSDK